MSQETDNEVFEQVERKRLKFDGDVETAKEFVNLMSNYVNYNSDPKAFIEAFKREHRTLQQSMFKMFLMLMEEMTTENYHTDGRNETSKAVAKDLLAGFKEVVKARYIKEGTSPERAEDYVSGNGTNPSAYLPLI